MTVLAWVGGIYFALFVITGWYTAHCGENRIVENPFMERLGMIVLIPMIGAMLLVYLLWLIVSYPFSAKSREMLRG